MKNLTEYLNQYNIKLQIGSLTIVPDGNMEQSIINGCELNNKIYLEDQPDSELNPKVISKDKILVFIKGLLEVDETQMEEMKDKTIHLSYSKLYLNDCLPVFINNNSYELDFKVTNSPFVRPRLKTTFNQKEAIRLLEKAKNEVNSLNQSVEELENNKELTNETSGNLKNQKKSKEIQRYYAAMVYKMNADVLYNKLQNLTYESDFKRAIELEKEYYVLTNKGMPTFPK